MDLCNTKIFVILQVSLTYKFVDHVDRSLMEHTSVSPVSSHTITLWECSFLIDFCYFSFHAWQNQEGQRQVPETERKIEARFQESPKFKNEQSHNRLRRCLSFPQPEFQRKMHILRD